jgi:hypothetical protein
MTRYLLFIFAFILVGCDKGELPIEPHEIGDEIITQVDLGGDYRNQLYYDLEKNEVIHAVVKTTWDLEFESDPNGWRVYLNSSRGGAVAHTGTTEFNAITSTADANWVWDAATGHGDSTAVGNWVGQGEVLILDLGYSFTGTHTGYRKVILESFDANSFTFSYADLDGGNAHEHLVLQKDFARTFTAYSLISHQVIEATPISAAWDLKFSQYTHIFDSVTPYLVTGVLLNPAEVEVYRDDTNAFDEISFEDASTHQFSTDWNAIGYGWKWYNYDQGLFEIVPGLTYVIKSYEGIYYKLQFLDFYSTTGVKGAPMFRVQAL